MKYDSFIAIESVSVNFRFVTKYPILTQVGFLQNLSSVTPVPIISGIPIAIGTGQ